jgi:TolB-like protein/Flp pilus assembly protein TadD
MSDSVKGVFLSYASQDAAAVERIAEALRAAGVEVWFDRNELVGGDAWDRKIRQQIRECALFVPVISAATQARGEGYFRLEWKLAVDRSHLMAPDQPFLLPVVIDDTPDAAARVADEFRAVQWTRLRQAYDGQARPAESEALEKFCARVKRLLDGSAALQPALEAPQRGLKPRATPGTGRRVLTVAAIGALVAVVVIGSFLALRPNPKTEPALSEARRLVAKARQVLDEGDDANREIYFAAEDLLKLARALDESDGEVWAAQAQVSWTMAWAGYDRSGARRETMRTQAERAIKLAPHSLEAQLAYAQHLILSEPTAPDGIKALEELSQRHPTDRRLFRVLAHAYSSINRPDDAVAAFDRANAIPGGDARALVYKSIQLLFHGRYDEAEQAVAQSLALQVTGRAQMADVLMKLCWRGDLDGAAAALERWPAWLRLEDRGVFVASQVWLWRDEPDKAIAVLNGVTRDVLNDALFIGPRATLLALAHEQAGRVDAARGEWENALKSTERYLKEDASVKMLLACKATALARLGRTAEAEVIYRELEQLNELRSRFWSCDASSALLRIALGRADEVVRKFDTERRVSFSLVSRPPTPRASLRHNPVFRSIRATPEFQRWMESAPAPEEKKENKPTGAAPAPPVNEKSLVVLPLENLSPDPENAFFTDGMHIEITTTLSRLSDLKVISRDSALALKGTSASLAEKAQKVGVANVITGSVRREGTTVSISLEMRRARDEALLWAQSYKKELGEGVLAIQADIAEQVARVLQARSAKGSLAGAKFMTKNREAYDRFIKIWRAMEADYAGVQGAAATIKELEEILRLDPGFATAAQVLANSHSRAYQNSTDSAVRAGHASEAKRWADTASRLAPGGAGDDALANYYYRIERNYPLALEFANNVILTLPNDTTGHNRAGLALNRLGRKSEAAAAHRRAIELDPLNYVFWQNLSLVLVDLRRPSEAEAAMDQLASLRPATFAAAPLRFARFALSGTLPDDVAAAGEDWLRRARRFPDLLKTAEAALVKSDLTDLNQLHWLEVKSDALHLLGRTEEAKAAASVQLAFADRLRLTDANERRQIAGYRVWALARQGNAEAAIAAARRWVDSISKVEQFHDHQQAEIKLAELYAYLRRPRECCELLAKLLRVPSGLTVPMLKADPAWDNVRADPAFQALLADPKNSAPL